MCNNHPVFEMFKTWQLIESFATEFIRMSDFDGVEWYLPSQRLYKELSTKDSDRHVHIEEYQFVDQKFLCYGVGYDYEITYNDEYKPRVDDSPILIPVDLETLNDYLSVDVTIQREINRCKLTVDVHRGNIHYRNVPSLLEVVDIQTFELIRQYINMVVARNNYILLDSQAIKSLSLITVDNKLTNYLMGKLAFALT